MTKDYRGKVAADLIGAVMRAGAKRVMGND